MHKRRSRAAPKRATVYISVAHWGLVGLDVTKHWRDGIEPDEWLPDWAKQRHLIHYHR